MVVELFGLRLVVTTVFLDLVWVCFVEGVREYTEAILEMVDFLEISRRLY